MRAEIITIEDLIIKHLKGDLNSEERNSLEAWLAESAENRRFFENLTDQKTLRGKLIQFHEIEISKNLHKPFQRRDFEDPKIRRFFPFRRVAVAAIFILALSTGTYFLFFNKPKQELAENIPQSERFKNDVTAPQSNKATLTLADGRTISLDSLTLLNQGSVSVTKNEKGEIVYTGSEDLQVRYNTLTVPKGSKPVQLFLADGSQVWLDAATTLTYPTAFVGKERIVKLVTGQAYFEVSTKYDVRSTMKQPFIVSKGDMEVTVLGTKFNVNAYDDEAEIKVTLLEGSVKVSTKYDLRSTNSALLKPGQQAQIAGEIKVMTGIDLEAVMAWKNGRFKFNEASLKTVMKEIARWYNVEVVYQGSPNMRFGGEMDKGSTLIRILKILEESGVRFKIEEKTVTVL